MNCKQPKCFVFSFPQKLTMAVVDGVTLVATLSVKVLQEGDSYSTLLQIVRKLHGEFVSLFLLLISSNFISISCFTSLFHFFITSLFTFTCLSCCITFIFLCLSLSFCIFASSFFISITILMIIMIIMMMMMIQTIPVWLLFSCFMSLNWLHQHTKCARC